MNEAQVIALAGLTQAAALVRALATEGRCDPAALEASLASVFRLDADSAAAVYGGLDGIRVGLRALISQIDGAQRDLAITQIVLALLRIERKLARRADLRQHLQDGILSAQRQAEHFGLTHPSVSARLGELYAQTLSTVRPRVVVTGNPLHLRQPAQVERIRAALLAGVRAAVLWRQLGGNHWSLLLRRRQCEMLARGLLSRATLDGG